MICRVWQVCLVTRVLVAPLDPLDLLAWPALALSAAVMVMWY